MKKIVILLCILTISSNAQWVQISTVPTTQLNAVKFFDQFTGIVVGNNGIWRSTNSGVNWNQVLLASNLNSVSFPDNNTGYSVGDSGKIYKSTNSGINWNQIGIGLTTKKLNGVSFPNAATGWVVGDADKILYTFNGGNSFTTQTTGANDTTLSINFIQMINANTGYLCGSATSETYAFTPNGGINWLYTLNTGGNVLNSVSNIPISYSYAVCVGTNGRIRRTTNQGTVWTIISSPTNVVLNEVIFLDANTGYIVGNSGNILKTTNSGLNWVVDAVITSNNLRCLSFINSTTAWAVGSNGVVIRQGIPVGIIQVENEVPKIVTLFQNYPNPFNPSTRIKFSLLETSSVKLIIYDLCGREIETLIDGEITKGVYEISFPTTNTNLASGIYIVKLISSNQSTKNVINLQKKMILVK